MRAVADSEAEPSWLSPVGTSAPASTLCVGAVCCELSAVSCWGSTAEKRRRAAALHRSDLFELGVAFYEFFGAAAGEGYGDAAVVFVAFDGDDSADAVFGVADFAAH